MKHVLYSEEYIYYLQLKRYKCLSKLGRVLMLWSKGILPPTDIHELLRCYATFAILKTFGFADFLRKSLHPHVFAGPKLQNLIVQARTAFGAFAPGIILSSCVAAKHRKKFLQCLQCLIKLFLCRILTEGKTKRSFNKLFI